MKLISWNVNGLRACMQKGFDTFFNGIDADIFAVQETKMKEEQKSFDFSGYEEYWNSADRAGYSGTLIYTRKKPLNVIYGIHGGYNDEGRAITLEFDRFYFVTVYSPNSKDGLLRLPYRMEYEDALRAYLTELAADKPVILCGDLNVAHEPIDLENPKTNVKNAGFTPEEREKFTALLDSGFVDSFRWLHPDEVKYSWWSYRFRAREHNAGWRIDYFVVSQEAKDRIRGAEIHNDVFGSDHCPIELDIDF